MSFPYRRFTASYARKLAPYAFAAGTASMGALKAYQYAKPAVYRMSKYASGTRNRRRYKRRKPVYVKTKGLKKQVKQLSRIAKADQGTLVYRRRQTFDAQSSANSSAFVVSNELNSLANMELVLAQLRYYNPSDPVNLITASGNTGSFSKDFFFDMSFHKITLRNNYQVPVRIKAYIFKVKEDTSQTPMSAFTAGLTDVGNPSATSALVYPTDSRLLNEIWKIDKSLSCILQPGQEKVISVTLKKFVYDPATSDTHSLTYQRSFDGSNFNLRVEGVCGHDTTLDEQGILQGGVDGVTDSVWKVLYPAGADIKTIIVNDNSDTFTNSGVVTNKPYADNQPYSQS